LDLLLKKSDFSKQYKWHLSSAIKGQKHNCIRTDHTDSLQYEKVYTRAKLAHQIFFYLGIINILTIVFSILMNFFASSFKNNFFFYNNLLSKFGWRTWEPGGELENCESD
jgi:hypothetical protein